MPLLLTATWLESSTSCPAPRTLCLTAGGIVRCDMIAEGIIAAVKEVGVSIPVIVRLEGTNAPLAREILAKSGLAITPASDLTDAAKKAVNMAGAQS